MTLTFLYPIAAWLFALLPLVWWPMRLRPRCWGHLALRVGVFACLIVALMQPSLVRRNAAGVQVFVLDQRASLGRDGQAAARAALARVVARTPGGPAHLDPAGWSRRCIDCRNADIVTDGSLSTALTRALDAIRSAPAVAVTLIASDRSTERPLAGRVRRSRAVASHSTRSRSPRPRVRRSSAMWRSRRRASAKRSDSSLRSRATAASIG